MLEKTKLGELTLSYMDEAGFVQTQPNRSAWTETGEVHLITAARGKRLNVMAALISTGELFHGQVLGDNDRSSFWRLPRSPPWKASADP
ncbi:MAG: hypothetical protein IPK44_13940 [Candidatus Accumulibacter sp.]|uniref:hypothetical protein n=1 Tax=Accumulibacter sp. TaxID=2053492 RepID=UPI00258628AB|nr:hypothetical protein [Accumulibacter sp.]MBK8115538.1 hypothetical protein [Accumulibacter sp.]